MFYKKKIALMKVAYSLNIISGSFIKWHECHSHLSSLHVYHIGVICGKKLKNAGGVDY